MHYGIQRAYLDYIKENSKIEGQKMRNGLYFIKIYYENSWDEWVEHMLYNPGSHDASQKNSEQDRRYRPKKGIWFS